MNAIDKIPSIILAILIDLIMIIPFIDFIITVPLQWILWERYSNDLLKYGNITYDVLGDFIIPGVGDLLPMNTFFVIIMEIQKRSD